MTLLPDIERLLALLAPDMGDSGNLPAYLEQILATAQEFFAPDLSVITAINPVTEQFIEPAARRGEFRDESSFLALRPRPEGITHRALAERMPLFVEHVSQEVALGNHFTAAEAIQAYAVAPLLSNPDGMPLAVLYLDYRQPRPFSAGERTLFQMLARQAAVHLHQTWLLHRYAEVNRIGQEINQELSTVDALFEKLAELIGDIVESDHFFMLATYQRQTDRLNLYVREQGRSTNITNDPVSGGCLWVLKHKQPLLIRHLSRDQLPPELEFEHIPGMKNSEESLLYVPLTLRGMLFGVLSVQHTQPNTYDNEDVRVLQVLANHVALALSNIRLFDNIKQINETGQLLTRQLDATTTIAEIVERIRSATRADIVTLYPYTWQTDTFNDPHTAGELYAPEYTQVITSRQDHMANLAVTRTEAVFAKDSREIYSMLGGDIDRRIGRFEQREAVQSSAAVPLRTNEEPVGVLFINFRKSQRFDAPQKQLMESLANYAAIAITNSRAFDVIERRRLRELETLQQIDRALNQTLELQPTLQAILALAIAEIPATRAAIYLYDRRLQLLETKAIISEDPAYGEAFTLRIDERRGLVWSAFEHKQPVRVGNVKTNPQWHAQYVKVFEDIQAELDVPLVDRGEVVGVINFESVHENAFSQQDEDFLVTLAGQAVLAVKNARSYNREQRLVRESQALLGINAQIIKQLDSREVFNQILEKALEQTNADAGTLMLYDQRQGLLRVAAAKGIAGDWRSHSLAEGIVGYAASTRQLVNVGDVTAPEWAGRHLPYIPNIRSELAAPLLEGDILRGVLNVESYTPNQFRRRNERFLQGLANFAVAALQTAERYRRAEDRQERLRHLHQIDEQIISQAGEVDLVVEAILRAALALTKADHADLHLYQGNMPTQTFFLRRAGELARSDQIKGETEAPPIMRGIIARVAQTRAPHLTRDDAQADPFYQGDPAENIHSEVAVPLKAADRVFGVLNLESAGLFVFDDDDVEVLELLASQAMIAIQNARNYQRLQLLDEVGRQLAAVADVSEIKQAYVIIREAVRRLHPDSQVTVRRYDELTEELRLVDHDPDHQIQPREIINYGNGLNGIVVQQKTTLLVPNLEDSLHGPLLAELSPLAQSWMGMPITFSNSYFGNLALTLMEPNRVFGVDQILFEELAKQLAITIHRLETAKRNRDIEIISFIGHSVGALTHSLPNHLGLISTEIKQIKKYLGKLSAIDPNILKKLIDIDEGARKVLDLNTKFKQDLVRMIETPDTFRQPEALAIKPILERTMQSFPRLPRNVQVRTEIAPDIAPVHAIAHQIDEILRNLYVNAIQALPRGGTIELRAHNAGNSVTIQIIDNGKGIPEELINRIFDLSVSGKGSSGFGLWIAREYALANNGYLTFKSQPGETIFTLTLPQARTIA